VIKAIIVAAAFDNLLRNLRQPSAVSRQHFHVNRTQIFR